ncbi:hypothetical protein F7731_15485 [Cytobacillus depressus]|uniref:Uncharacterized protein n=1 Tax=Cytobacillus depressus TaxID=1602942 RepID=A0A6L3V4V0_9BACI|nr:hypothetical protein [Cytobacillus depressus]KAB2333263.1 hypothetical protein F7731_15485 [Cytobacillus depressus]
MFTGTVAVVMVFSIPIIAIVTTHLQKQSKIKHKIIQDQIELEKLKQENYLIETQKMKLEIEQMQLEDFNNKQKIL